MSVLRSRTISCLLTGVLAGLVLAPDGRSQEQSTFVGLSISDGIVTEEYTFVDEIIPGGPPTVSIIDEREQLAKAVSPGDSDNDSPMMRRWKKFIANQDS